MNAKEFAFTIEWSEIKSVPEQLIYVQQGLLWGEALTKGGRWIKVYPISTVIYDTNTPQIDLILSKQWQAVSSLIKLLKKPMQGIKGHKGRFTLVDFRK